LLAFIGLLTALAFWLVGPDNTGRS
jgi:hypothetical protein